MPIEVLGTIIGATSGLVGIVVVILSIIVLVQVRRQVDTRFDEKYAAHQQALSADSAQWAQGIRYWTQAMMTTDPVQAAPIMDQALQAWPTAPRARSEMAARLIAQAEEGYLMDLIPGYRDDLKTMFEVAMESPFYSAASPPILIPPSANIPLCLEWLIKAQEHEANDGDNRAVLALLAARVRAMLHDGNAMLGQLSRWITEATEPPNSHTVKVLLSSLETPDQVQQFRKLWKFKGHSLWSIAELMHNVHETPGDALRYWLVLPLLSGGPTTVIGVSHPGPEDWRLVSEWTSDRLNRETLTFNAEALKQYIEARWIVLTQLP